MKSFLAGLGIGIGVGMLFAPESGEVNRKKLNQRLTRWSEDLAQVVDESKTRVQDQVASLNDRAKEALRSGRKDQGRNAEDADSVNTMSREELMAIKGIGPVLADKVISGRPYSSPRDLLDRGVLPQSTFDELEREMRHRAKRSA